MAENTRQGAGIISLGTPTNPTLYTARVLQGPSEWQRVAIAFIATEPILRLSLLGQAGGPGNTVEYDGIRFLPPGRNPVLLMAAIFARFLPHLTLDAASVAAAADRRNEWLFSGYIPDPGRTDQLLTKMSQECFCTVFKDLDGVYKITADDPDHSPVLHLESTQDIFQDSLAVEGLPMAEVSTDFYLWYQRVTTQVTTSQAGQYAAVLYVTPDASISQYSELQTLCLQAADAFHTRTRFDFYSDFIADPATADLLLSRLVRQLSVLRHDVTVQAAMAALPLSVTDHVAVHAPLLGPTPFIGELRRAELAFTAQAPGLALGLTLRQSGLMRGSWETWDVAGAGPESYPACAPRVRETWPAPAPGGAWFLHTQFGIPDACYALLAVGTEQLDLGAGQRLTEPVNTPRAGPPVRLFRESNIISDVWSLGLGAPYIEGLCSAIALYEGEVYAAIQPAASPGVSQLWRLHPSASGDGTGEVVASLPTDVRVWAMAAYDFSDGRGVGLYLGTGVFARLYRWEPGEAPTVALDEGAYLRRFRSLAIDPATGVLWAAQDNTEASGTGRTVMYHVTALGYNAHTLPDPATQTCNMVAFGGTLWAATGVQDGSQISLWSITHGVGVAGRWDRRYTLTGLANQQPGCLGVFGGRLYLGRISTTATPMLEVASSADPATSWAIEFDLASIPNFGDPDHNQGITAMVAARGKFYAATSTLNDEGLQNGLRVYIHPIEEEPV